MDQQAEPGQLSHCNIEFVIRFISITSFFVYHALVIVQRLWIVLFNAKKSDTCQWYHSHMQYHELLW